MLGDVRWAGGHGLLRFACSLFIIYVHRNTLLQPEWQPPACPLLALLLHLLCIPVADHSSPTCILPATLPAGPGDAQARAAVPEEAGGGAQGGTGQGGGGGDPGVRGGAQGQGGAAEWRGGWELGKVVICAWQWGWELGKAVICAGQLVYSAAGVAARDWPGLSGAAPAAAWHAFLANACSACCPAPYSWCCTVFLCRLQAAQASAEREAEELREEKDKAAKQVR